MGRRIRTSSQRIIRQALLRAGRLDLQLGQEGDNLLFGGRRIKTLLETVIERPLNRWIFENYSDLNTLTGKRLIVSVVQNGVLSITEA